MPAVALWTLDVYDLVSDTVIKYGYQYMIEDIRKMMPGQLPLETLNISHMLRSIMVVRGLTVSELADMAGVSKSAMEKYLAGPSSPRAVAIANLSLSLKLSADMLMFGELDPHVEVAYQLAFKAFAKLIEDLKSHEALAAEFATLDPKSKQFSDFVRDLAFERAGQFKRTFNADRRDEHFGIL